MEAETGIMARQAKELQTASKHQKLEETKNGFSPRASGGIMALMTSLFQIYELQNCEKISTVLGRSLCGYVLQQP